MNEQLLEKDSIEKEVITQPPELVEGGLSASTGSADEGSERLQNSTGSADEGSERLQKESVDTESVDTEVSRQFERRTALWRLAIFGILLAFIALLIIGLRRQIVSERRVSGVAPEFEFTTFEGDEVIRFSDLKGQGVVLNFWASWCGPCRDEAVLLEQTWRREQGNGIVFVGLDYLDQNHAALAYLEEFGITYPNGVDKQSIWARRYGIEGVPETFFIAPDGTIADIVIGPLLSQTDLDNRLNKIRPDN